MWGCKGAGWLCSASTRAREKRAASRRLQKAPAAAAAFCLARSSRSLRHAQALRASLTALLQDSEP